MAKLVNIISFVLSSFITNFILTSLAFIILLCLTLCEVKIRLISASKFELSEDKVNSQTPAERQTFKFISPNFLVYFASGKFRPL